MYNMRNISTWLSILAELFILWPCMNLLNIPNQEMKPANLVRVKRGWSWEPLYVTEEQEVKKPMYVGQLKTDSDDHDDSIKYVLLGDGAGTIFVMNEHSGKISVIKKLDREEKPFYTLRAQAISRFTGIPVEAESEFVIKVLDINDNEPKFINEPYIAEVSEMSPKGTYITQVIATDKDDPTNGNNARLVYSILQGQPQFSIEIKSGIIRVASLIDRETKDQYQVIVQAKDMIGDAGALSATTTVIINILDVNDNAPKFQQKTYEMSIIESASVGEIVGVVLADDIDIGKNAEVTYSIEQRGDYNMFTISTDVLTKEGIIRLNKLVDFESRSRRYNIQVRAENKYKSDLFDTATIRIFIVDVDEPPVFLEQEYFMEIPENATVGSYVGSVTAKDPDRTDTIIRYGILHNKLSRSFEIHPNNGSVFTMKYLDREVDQWHNITVTATEAKSPAYVSNVHVYIRVMDVNDNPPQLQDMPDIYVCEKSAIGQPVHTITAIDKDEPKLSHEFSFTQHLEESTIANFTITDNEDNTATVLTAQDGYSAEDNPLFYLTVIISDNGSPSLSSTSTLAIKVCDCDADNNTESCGKGGFFFTFMNLGAIIGISVFILLILVLALLVHVRCQKNHNIMSEKGEDLKENIVKYDDEGGGEEDTEAFDITGLRHHTVMRERKPKRTIRTDIQSMYRLSLGLGPDVAIFKEFLSEKLEEANTDTSVLPLDFLHCYSFEGTGSPSGSLSSLSFTESNVSEIDPYY
ncbi:cadherin-19-like [Bufo bufo]|uniref:cadherin-19-like n=1 Tax=Bufo bufo TaxID=8384 RepID=UPI001ABE1B2F|nr:cadherin-19-like [Bufo bufo]